MAKAEDPKRVVHRWMEGAAEFGLRADGHYVVIRCGAHEPGVRVRARMRPGHWRRGTLKALLPGFGPAPRPVFGAVEFDPVPGSPVGKVTRVFPISALVVVVG